MFHKTSTKLAALYLAIIMTISLFFSVVVYQLSIHEFDRGLRGPNIGLERRPELGIGPAVRQQLQQEREELYQQAKSRILVRLILVNIMIAVGGGFLSYHLARRTLRPIEETHAALERFTADASHELRTPLAAMRTEIEVALENPKLSLKESKNVLSSNLEEVERLTSLSSGLLKLARLQEKSLQLEEISTKQIIDQSVEQLARSAKAKNISVEKTAVTDVSVRGDSELLTEVINILLDNAIKYSPQQSVITITAASSGRGVQISVTDEGAGISPADLTRIFDRFYRASVSRSTHEASGYGLGLAIAQNIAQQHGGQLSATSLPGKGSTFTLLLP